MDPVAQLAVAVVAAGAVAGLIAAVVLLIRRRPPVTPSPPSAPHVPDLDVEPLLYIALDAPTIFNLYQQTRDAAVRVTTIDTKSSTVSLAVSPTLVDGGVERGTSGNVQIEYLPATYAGRAIAIVERKFQVAGSITGFDLTTTTDDGPLDDLLKNLHAGANLIGLRVPEEVDKALADAWRQQSRLNKDTTFESLGKYVRVRALFEVSPASADGERVFESVGHDHSGAVRVRIVCPRSHIEDSFPDEPEKIEIVATCLGRPKRTRGSWLELQPISIHLS